jgi:hypothetical protein
MQMVAKSLGGKPLKQAGKHSLYFKKFCFCSPVLETVYKAQGRFLKSLLIYLRLNANYCQLIAGGLYVD